MLHRPSIFWAWPAKACLAWRGEKQRAMTPAQEAFQAANLPLDLISDRRKDAYEALHPETKNSSFHGNQHKSGLHQVGKDQPADRFTADTAMKTGQTERAVRDWLSRIDKDSKEVRNRRIFDLWMACWTQDEISAACDCRETVRDLTNDFGEIGKLAEIRQSGSISCDGLHAVDLQLAKARRARRIRPVVEGECLN